MAEVPTQGTVDFKIIFQSSASSANNKDTQQAVESQNPSDPANLGTINASNPTQASASTQSNIASAAVNASMSLGKQAVSSVVNNIGLATGNNYAQQKAQNAMQGISMGASILTSVASGNPVMIASTLISTAITAVTQWVQNEIERKWNNLEAKNNARLYGFTTNSGR